MSQLDPREKQLQADHEWVRNNRDLIKEHGGKVVAVHKQNVLGVGNNHKEAIDNARQQPDCPDLEEIAACPLPVSL